MLLANNDCVTTTTTTTATTPTPTPPTTTTATTTRTWPYLLLHMDTIPLIWAEQFKAWSCMLIQTKRNKIAHTKTNKHGICYEKKTYIAVPVAKSIQQSIRIEFMFGLE